MTRILYDKPVEIEGKVLVSTEVLTHYRCPRCDKFSTASDVESIEVYCVYCGLAIRLPEFGSGGSYGPLPQESADGI